MIEFSTSWPARPLWQNWRGHWTLRRKSTSLARQEAKALANSKLATASGLRCHDAYAIECTFYPPDRRKRDRSNMPATVKAHLDGIADALGVDDNCFDVSWRFGDAQKPGRVDFTVMPFRGGVS